MLPCDIFDGMYICFFSGNTKHALFPFLGQIFFLLGVGVHMCIYEGCANVYICARD